MSTSVGPQAMGDSLTSVGELQLPDANTAAMVALDLAVLDVEHHRETTKGQVLHEFASVRVDGPARPQAWHRAR